MKDDKVEVFEGPNVAGLRDIEDNKLGSVVCRLNDWTSGDLTFYNAQGNRTPNRSRCLFVRRNHTDRHGYPWTKQHYKDWVRTVIVRSPESFDKMDDFFGSVRSILAGTNLHQSIMKLRRFLITREMFMTPTVEQWYYMLSALKAAGAIVQYGIYDAPADIDELPRMMRNDAGYTPPYASPCVEILRNPAIIPAFREENLIYAVLVGWGEESDGRMIFPMFTVSGHEPKTYRFTRASPIGSGAFNHIVRYEDRIDGAMIDQEDHLTRAMMRAGQGMRPTLTVRRYMTSTTRESDGVIHYPKPGESHYEKGNGRPDLVEMWNAYVARLEAVFGDMTEYRGDQICNDEFVEAVKLMRLI